MMVASGKGGTGKSTLSVLLGAALAERGQRVLLMELDAGFRSVDQIAGLDGKIVYDAGDVLSGRCDAAKAVVESPLYRDLFLIAAPYACGRIRPEALCLFTQRVAPVFDTILLDTAAGMGDAFCAAQKAARKALLVLTPDPVSIRGGGAVCAALAQSGCGEIRLVVNQTPHTLEGSGTGSLDECIDTVGAQLLGVVPWSGAIRKAGHTGSPLSRLSREWRVMRAIAARLCGEHVPLLIR